ncbi:MAG TPA: type II toxin-antitoxin system RelE/ParE family toxin [Stellaceae bacterium]|nr:type II toxin-antitoxin system RelE/ParE family toxin [Stellaceae bacterium]
MTAALLAPRARRELVAAVRLIANDNPRAAQALRDAVAQAARHIGDHPHIGVVRSHLLRPAYRFLVLSGFPYLIIYNAERSPPEIVAIVHGARNLPPLLRDLD